MSITDRNIKLRLKNNKGEYEEFMIDYVPQSKKLEYIRKEANLEEELAKEGNKLGVYDQIEYDEMQAEFVASLFPQKEVTKEAILEGLDALEFSKVYEIVRHRVLGYPVISSEDEKKD